MDSKKNDIAYNTILSQTAWDVLNNREMSPGEAIEYFYQRLNIRRFSDILARFANGKVPDGKALNTWLTEKFREYNPSAKPDSIRRKISNWVNGATEPDERGDWIKICFALRLKGAEAQSFMNYSHDGALHIRNPREAAFLYCLNSDAPKTYPEALAFIDSLSIGDIGGQEPQNPASPLVLTKIIAGGLSGVYDDASFIEFFNANRANFGCLHNTAYVYFKKAFSCLASPDAPLYAEHNEAYSIERTVGEYLQMRMPSERNRAKYDALQKAVKNYWPNTTSITNILNRVEDVTRKTLILLYVVTEGVTGDDDESDDLEDSVSLEDHVWDLDLKLNEWGMGALDPRNPFDWLIMYSLKTEEDEDAQAGDDSQTMSKRLESVLSILFPQ